MKRKYSSWTYVRRITSQILEHPANRDHKVRALARGIGWQVRKRIIPKPVDVPYEGLTLRCYPDSNSASNVFYFTPRYDWDEMAFLERYLRPGDGFLDIGANIGTYSLLAASLIGPTGRIEAFEPLPDAAARVQENFDLNHLHQATLHQVAVSDEAGEVGFLDFDVSSSIAHDPERFGPATITVRQERIDALVEGPGFMAAKLDVEGVELQALRGAQALIDAKNPPVWQIELLEHQLKKFGTSIDEVVGWLADAGYSPAWYDAATNALEFDEAVVRRRGNAWFIADDHRALVEERLGIRSEPTA